MQPDDLQRIRERAELLYDSHAVEAALDRMAHAIEQRFHGQVVIFLPVMQGGLICAGMLATRIDLPLLQDYIHATRYRGDTEGGELIWRAKPMLPLAGRRVLVVDDILDEGHTLKAILDYCQAQGCREVASAVLIEKVHERRVPGVAADFVGLEVPDRYVFGYGLDYHAYFRNVPGIYAVVDS